MVRVKRPMTRDELVVELVERAEARGDRATPVTVGALLDDLADLGADTTDRARIWADEELPV